MIPLRGLFSETVQEGPWADSTGPASPQEEKEIASTHSHLQPLGPLKISNWKNAGLSNHQALFPVLIINYRIFSANNFYSQDLQNAVSATWNAGK